MTETAARDSASFPAHAASARDARRFLRLFLDHHGLGGLADAAELALSEVVTNAVLHAHTDLTVDLSLAPDRSLRVDVVDRNPQLPVQRHYGEHATTGRGMELVAALTADCGVASHGTAGKSVWFVVRPVDGEDAEPDADALLGAWGIDVDEAAGSASGPVTVTFLGLPSALWMAARAHHDAILRELALYALEHPERSPSPARLALADQARAWVSTRVVAEVDRLGGAGASAGSPLALDLQVDVPESAVDAFDALRLSLDAAEQLAVDGLLLARPGLPEIVEVRDWVCEQAVGQLAGAEPLRWSGTARERFTTEVRDRAAPQPTDWDPVVVTRSDRGVIAADDANRIVAVSERLARALGWRAGELVGRRVVAIIPAHLREAHIAGFARHLLSGESRILGTRLRLPVLRADGSTLDCDVLIERAPGAGRAVFVAWIEPAP